MELMYLHAATFLYLLCTTFIFGVGMRRVLHQSRENSDVQTESMSRVIQLLLPYKGSVDPPCLHPALSRCSEVGVPGVRHHTGSMETLKHCICPVVNCTNRKDVYLFVSGFTRPPAPSCLCSPSEELASEPCNLRVTSVLPSPPPTVPTVLSRQ